MSISCVVLDFDGTLTDVARESLPFLAVYPRLLGDLLGRDLVAGGLWDEAARRVDALSPELAWTVEGKAVGPAGADPYVAVTCIAELLLDRYHVLTGDLALRSEILTALFRRAYRETRAAFRPEAGHVLETLLQRGLPVHVVTNAPASVVATKLEGLVPPGLGRVHIQGDACKFLIGPSATPDERFDRLPPETRLAGLARPALLGRGRYFDALRRIWDETGAGPETTLVAGDIFELDLAMPAELGAQVHLVQRASTYPYEIDAVAALGARGGTSEGLLALLDRV